MKMISFKANALWIFQILSKTKGDLLLSILTKLWSGNSPKDLFLPTGSSGSRRNIGQDVLSISFPKNTFLLKFYYLLHVIEIS